MISYIALLKGVNVGGNRTVSMADLKAALTKLDYANVRTLLVSGNVVFDAEPTETATLEEKLEKDLASSLGVTTDIMVRDPSEWAAILAANPFPDEAVGEPSRLLVMVMKTRPDHPKATAYLAAYDGPEKVEFVGREIFIFYPGGQGASKLNITKFGIGTARNWNTMQKLAAIVEA
jgi:uncharacterized protein (DUF1697 family)